MSVTLNDIMGAKYTLLSASNEIYGFISQNLNKWYRIVYYNASTGVRKIYLFYITDIVPYIAYTKVYDFDIISTGYICGVENTLTNDFISLDVSTDNRFNNVLTKGTSDPDDDPIDIVQIPEQDVNTAVHTFIEFFVNSENNLIINGKYIIRLYTSSFRFQRCRFGF